MRLFTTKRDEVTHDQWEAILPALAKGTAMRERPASDLRLIVNGFRRILRTSTPWWDLSERFGPRQTVYENFARWRTAGVYDRIILKSLHIWLDGVGEIDWDLWCIDGSSVRATRAAAGAAHPDEPKDPALGRWQGGFGSKFHLVADGRGLPLTVEVTAGQVNDLRCGESMMDKIALPQEVGMGHTASGRL